MEVTVIGFWGGFPKVNEATSGYLVESDGFKLLVDCGSAVLAKLQEYLTIDELDAVILSHYHNDHIADVGPLQYARYVTTIINGKGKTLPIYGHKLDKGGFQKLTYKDATKGIEYTSDQVVSVGPFTISFLETSHPAPCFAMKITDHKSTVIYTADSSYKHEFIPFSNKADLLIAECSLYSHQDGAKMGHMNCREVGEIAQKAGVNQLLITHLPHFGDHNDLKRDAENIFSGKVLLAKSGLKINCS